MLPTYYNTLAVEEESSGPCAECEVPRDLLLHIDQFMPPLGKWIWEVWGELIGPCNNSEQEEEQQ